MEKNKKKTLTISTNLKKKLIQVKYHQEQKNRIMLRKKNLVNLINKIVLMKIKISHKARLKRKNYERKFVEQQATKDFIKKDNKPAGKSKLKLKGPVDKRDFKLTVSRALNVEEIEIKQRSLASVKRARLKEKKSKPEDEEKKNLKK